MGLAADLLAIDDIRKPLRLTVRAWKRDVWLADPTAAMRDEWEIFCQANALKPAQWRAKLASLILCDEEGNRLFNEKDIVALSKKSASALQEIWLAGVKRMSVSDSEVEELEKNSEAPAAA